MHQMQNEDQYYWHKQLCVEHLIHNNNNDFGRVQFRFDLTMY